MEDRVTREWGEGVIRKIKHSPLENRKKVIIASLLWPSG